MSIVTNAFMHSLTEYTSEPVYTLWEATSIANRYAKNSGIYYTAIRQDISAREDHHFNYPQWCWSFTNRYDPRVTKNANT